MTHAISYTSRGFGVYASFDDYYDKRVTMQDSSLATEPCVWLGVHEHRSHLTIDMATEIRDQLTGWLIDVGAEEPKEATA